MEKRTGASKDTLKRWAVNLSMKIEPPRGWVPQGRVESPCTKATRNQRTFTFHVHRQRKFSVRLSNALGQTQEFSPDCQSWIAAREKFFLPINVLRPLFRGKFLAALRQAYDAGQLKLAASTAELSQPRAWLHFLDQLCWVRASSHNLGHPRD